MGLEVKKEEQDVPEGFLDRKDVAKSECDDEKPSINASPPRSAKFAAGGKDVKNEEKPSSQNNSTSRRIDRIFHNVKKEEDDVGVHLQWVKSEEGASQEDRVDVESKVKPSESQRLPSMVGHLGESVVSANRDRSLDVGDASGSAIDEPVIRKEEPEDDIAAFMAERENPILKKVKKKDELFALPADTVYSIITQTGLTDIALPEIDPRVRDTFVSRYLVSDILGGSPQDTFPTPRPEKIAEHGIKSYLCLVYSFNPFAPQLPGKSGLFFGMTRRGLSAAEREDTERIVYPYFMRVDANKWHYLGHYEFKGGRPLTVEEWRQQSPLCKRTWTRDVMTCKAFTKYRAYVRLRRSLEEDEEVKPEALKETELDMLANKRLDDVSLEEIETAFDRGHLSINARGMQCVRYDVAFQQNLYDHSLNWSTSSKKQTPSTTTTGRRKRKSKVKVQSDDSSPDSDSDGVEIISVSARKSTKSTSASLNKKRTPQRRRRRRSDDTSESSSDSDDAMDIDDLDNIRERSQSYVSRGTRSRPAKQARTIIVL